MSDLGPILVGVAAIVSILVVAGVARQVFSGSLVPLPVRELIEGQQQTIALLKEQNATFQDERLNDKVQLRELIAEATKAIFAITTFLNRYESLGGFASPGYRRVGDPAQPPPE